MTAPDVARAGLWRVAPERTRATFTLRKLGLVRVRGAFCVREGSAELAADGSPRSAAAVLDAASFATGNARRDTDVAGRRFLDAGQHPTIDYRADRIDPVDGGWLVRGQLAVRGVTAPLDLTATVDLDAGEARLTCTGLLDRGATGLPGPRWLIGRWVAVEVTAVLVPAGDRAGDRAGERAGRRVGDQG